MVPRKEIGEFLTPSAPYQQRYVAPVYLGYIFSDVTDIQRHSDVCLCFENRFVKIGQGVNEFIRFSLGYIDYRNYLDICLVMIQLD